MIFLLLAALAACVDGGSSDSEAEGDSAAEVCSGGSVSGTIGFNSTFDDDSWNSPYVILGDVLSGDTRRAETSNLAYEFATVDPGDYELTALISGSPSDTGGRCLCISEKYSVAICSSALTVDPIIGTCDCDGG